MTLRHFLDLSEPVAELRTILDAAHAIKAARKGKPQGALDQPGGLANRQIALIFEFPSTRTRVSFQAGIHQQGGASLVINKAELQLGRGETIADTARVLSRYVDGIVLRAERDRTLREMASAASVPVVNGLTDVGHPCQIMADIMTYEENRGSITGKRVAWIGDTNNVARSWIEAAAKFKFALTLAAPISFQPTPISLARARESGAQLSIVTDAASAVREADVIVTDTWVSMAHANRNERVDAFRAFQVNEALMSQAAPNAVFLHCLPAHRGEEVTDGVLDGPQSLAWDEAENRMHAQKAILRWCLGV